MGCTCTKLPSKQETAKDQPADRASKYRAPDQPQPKVMQKAGKKTKTNVPRRAPVPPEVYLYPQKVVEMACKEEAKFIKLMKDSDVRDFSQYVGFESGITLASGNRPSTLEWNPLVFALVQGKQELCTFLLKQSIDVYRLL